MVYMLLCLHLYCRGFKFSNALHFLTFFLENANLLEII